MAYSGTLLRFTASYVSACSLCSRSIVPGEEGVHWANSYDKWAHIECWRQWNEQDTLDRRAKRHQQTLERQAYMRPIYNTRARVRRWVAKQELEEGQRVYANSYCHRCGEDFAKGEAMVLVPCGEPYDLAVAHARQCERPKRSWEV